jgi:hypothetical protein
MSHNNKSAERGTRFAVSVVGVLAESGFPHAEHRRQRGRNDAGDIAGTIGIAWQLKDEQTLRPGLAIDAAQLQKSNAGADFGIAVLKRRGKHARDAYAMLPLSEITRLLRMAGYGDPLPETTADGRVIRYEPGFAVRQGSA